MSKIEIELDENGKINTNSGFDLATTIVVLEKLRSKLVQRAQIRKQKVEESDEEDEE